jgi:hypothetical protein
MRTLKLTEKEWKEILNLFKYSDMCQNCDLFLGYGSRDGELNWCADVPLQNSINQGDCPIWWILNKIKEAEREK